MTCLLKLTSNGARIVDEIHDVHPDLPQTPLGFPNTFIEMICFDDPCAIPLKTQSGWRWHACYSGNILLCNNEWGPASQFESFETALDFARRFRDSRGEPDAGTGKD